MPSAFNQEKFKCYSTVGQVLVILGYVLSLLSSLFSIYKLRIFIRERMQRLKAAGIKPTLKRVVFLQRTLANHSKHMLVSLTEQPDATPMTEAMPTSDEAVVRMVRDLQAQMQQQQQQQQQREQHQKDIQQLLQQQQQASQEQLVQLQTRMQQQVQELQVQLSQLQSPKQAH